MFCGRNARLTKEDAIPNWVRRNFPFSGPFNLYVGDKEVPGAPLTLIRAITVTVCRTCNNTWMSQLEQQAKTLVLPMIHGAEGIMLTTADQELIARWALKTAGMVELAMVRRRGGNFIGQHHLASLFATTAVPRGTYVWLFRYVPDRGLSCIIDSVVIGSEESRGFLATLTLGYFGFRVLGFEPGAPELDHLPDLGWGEPMDQFVIRISPSTPQGQPWPPTKWMTTADLRFAIRQGPLPFGPKP